MTFEVLTDDFHSNFVLPWTLACRICMLIPLVGSHLPFVKLCNDPTAHFHIDPKGDQTHAPTNEEGTNASQLPMLHPLNLVGSTFLLDPHKDGQCFCVNIIQAMEEHDSKLYNNSTHYKLRCS